MGFVPARSRVVGEPPLLLQCWVLGQINPVPSCLCVLGFVSERLVPGTPVPKCPNPRPTRTRRPVLGAESWGCGSSAQCRAVKPRAMMGAEGPGWTVSGWASFSAKGDLSAAGSCAGPERPDLERQDRAKACSTSDLKELLIFNKQEVPSGESAVSCPCVTGAASQAARPCVVTVPVQCGRPSG